MGVVRRTPRLLWDCSLSEAQWRGKVGEHSPRAGTEGVKKSRWLDSPKGVPMMAGLHFLGKNLSPQSDNDDSKEEIETSKIEVTSRQLFGYGLIVAGIILFIYVVLNGILLANGTFEPLRIPMANSGYGNDVFAGILLQIGVFGVLAGIGFAVAKIGLGLVKD